MNNKALNIKYALVNAAYLMLLCATGGYAYNYLAQCGFQDGQIGLTITTISILGLVCQTVFGSLIDKSDRLDERTFVSITMILSTLSALLLAVLPVAGFLSIALCIIGFTSAAVGVPFLNSMAFIYESEGFTINYGLGRGIGSAAYAVGSALLGKLWSGFGKEVLPIFIIILSLATLFLVQLMPKVKGTKAQNEETSSLSYPEFFKKYRQIILPALGMVLIYFCHMLINTYFAKFIIDILHDSSTAVEGIQGTALFIQAMCELPTMLAFGWLIKKFSINKLLLFAAVLYSVKHVLLYVCGSIPMLYVIMVLQMFTYAILCPGGVYLSNEIVAPEDRNKGQAIIGITATIGGLLASFIGGQLFTVTSTHIVLLIGVIATILGSLLMITGILTLKKK